MSVRAVPNRSGKPELRARRDVWLARPRLRINALSIAGLLCLAACGGDGHLKAHDGGRDGEDGGRDGEDGGLDSGNQLDDAGSAGRFTLSGPGATLELTSEPYPTATFTLTDHGQPAPGVTYTVNRTDLGSIDRASGVFTPSGVAGTVVVTALTADGGYATTSLTINVSLVSEGDPGRDTLPVGAGGVGGVGGEGGGTPIADPDVRAVLDTTPVEDPGLSWLYPYDGTVWPRGLPSPLFSWSSTVNTPLAVRIHVEVDDHYKFDGYFGPPTALPGGRALTHLPLPQAAWKAALASGSTMRVSIVTAARAAGGALKAFRSAGPLTFKIAPGSLKGTVYYNSYGTKLAENSGGAVGGNKRFGGATLAVRGDSFDPVLVAGSTTSDGSGCRVCHTVSGNGGLLMVQREPNTRTSSYDLLNNKMETARPSADDGKFGWAALSPDGSLALGNSGPPGSNGSNVASLDHSALYDVATGAVLNTPGFTGLVSRAAMPAFSPDGNMVAFNFFAGTDQSGLQANGRSLLVMDIAKTDATTYTFGNPRAVYTGAEDAPPGWPSFLPDGMGLVFQRELARGAGNERFATRKGARGDLWWTDLSGVSHPLDRANGSMGLPSAAAHPDDATLQYEPAVGPIVAGGYAWVVFTSRRMYGDVATREPFESDPREYDLTPSAPTGPTTKKLWVFAFDMPPTPGKDPSHPAFYLPAQELYAGNSRGFWVPDACKNVGIGCGSGDECCGGYCRPATEFGEPVCSDYLPPASCAKEYEACGADTDCCADGPKLYCTGGRCAQSVILN